MSIHTTYTNARANLARLMDAVSEQNEIVIISRRKSANVAMIAADELSAIMESHHLLRSPQNARRLIDALDRARSKDLPVQSLENLLEEIKR